MFQYEVNGQFIVEQKAALEAALTTNPKTEKVLRDIIRELIRQARDEVVQGIRFANGDPRGSKEAVRTTVYKKVFGANINIFSRKRAGSNKNGYVPPRSLRPGQRGGNRVLKSERTQSLQEYGPLDRGFVLRFVNEGTGERAVKFKTDERRESVHRGSQGGSKYGKTINTGRRGSIKPRNFFKPLGDRALDKMRDNLSTILEEELTLLLPK